MISLNVINGAQTMLGYYLMVAIGKFQNNINAVEMGIGYGGGLEILGYILKGRGQAYGFDTFEALHPDHLAENKFSFEARCMDHWYDPSVYGTAALSYDFMRKQLDTEGLNNVHLIKGLVNKDSCADIPIIHYALLDMDIAASMKAGYDAVIDKMAKGGFLFLHDAVPKDHIKAVGDWYENVVKMDQRVKVIGEWPMNFLVGLEKV